MKKRYYLFIFVIIILIICQGLFADWVPVATGIDYQEFTLSDPNNVFVARMDRSNTNCAIDSCIAQGKLISGKETVSGMANRYDDTIGYWNQTWGTRYDVIVAINGAGFTTDQPSGGQIISGWYAKRFGEFSSNGFVWQLDRDVFLGDYLIHLDNKNKVAYPATSSDQTISGINRTPESNELIIFTPQYADRTYTDDTVTEVLVEMTRPAMIIPTPNYARGYVREIRQNQGSSYIPFDHIVLSAKGSAATQLYNNVSMDAEVRVSQEITFYDDNPGDMTKTYACIGFMTFKFLIDGVVPPSTHPQWNNREPRTAVAYNDDYIYFLVVDGRDPGVSVGMTMPEIGNFCITYLSATYGINQDGGGSSAIWVNGEVKNNPSDGSERWVTNGLMMAVVYDKQQSAAFYTGMNVKTISTTQMRLGPGTNYASITSVPADSDCEIIEHSINGVRAKGEQWWKCRFGSTEGWISESQLICTTSIPNWEVYY